MTRQQLSAAPTRTRPHHDVPSAACRCQIPCPVRIDPYPGARAVRAGPAGLAAVASSRRSGVMTIPAVMSRPACHDPRALARIEVLPRAGGRGHDGRDYSLFVGPARGARDATEAVAMTQSPCRRATHLALGHDRAWYRPTVTVTVTVTMTQKSTRPGHPGRHGAAGLASADRDCDRGSHGARTIGRRWQHWHWHALAPGALPPAPGETASPGEAALSGRHWPQSLRATVSQWPRAAPAGLRVRRLSQAEFRARDQ